MFRGFGIQKVYNGIPVEYSITEADIIGILPIGKTLQTEIVRGRLFMINNSVMNGIPCSPHPTEKVSSR